MIEKMAEDSKTIERSFFHIYKNVALYETQPENDFCY